MTAEIAPLEPAPADLATVEAVKATLAQMESVEDASALVDRAEVMRTYAQRARLGLEAQNHAALVKVLAQRKVGELLRDDPECGPGKGSTLKPLGLSKSSAHRWQRLADLAEDEIASRATEATQAQREFTTKSLTKSAPPQPAGMAPPPEGTFATITADPPWAYDNKATRGAATDHYGTLTVTQLRGDEPLRDGLNLAEQVREWAADQSHLYLWTTAGHLPDAFSVMAAWGFTYKTYLVWVKPQMGMGNYFRVSTELVLFGTKGGLRTNDRALVNWFEARRAKHSTKPAAFRRLVHKASNGPYLEMFARCRRHEELSCDCSGCEDGWTLWGDQA